MNCKVAVKGIIRRKDGNILIVKRSEDDSFWPGYWETVGGGMEKHEDPQIALLREIKEETNLEVKVREPFNVFTFENEEKEFKVGITFICDYESCDVNLSEEHVEYKWIDPLDIKQYQISKGVQEEIVSYANKYSKSYEKFNVSQKAVIIRDNKCFIAEIYKKPGVWDLPGGRIDSRENPEDGFKRELKEEAGIENFEVLAICDIDYILHPSGSAVYGIVSVIKTDEEIVISPEHAQGKWISEEEIDDYKYIWPAMARMIKKAFLYYKEFSNKE